MISRNSKQLLAGTFGLNSQLVLGWIGIVIHELSHLLVAVLFGHRITRVKLLNLSQNDGSLGSVSSTYNPNSLYQKMGNFFIGIAPIYGCFLAIIVVMKNFFPQIMILLENNSFTTSLYQPDEIFSIKGLIGLLILFSIVLGGFDLSRSDFTGMSSGATSMALVIIGIGLLFDLFHIQIAWQQWLMTISFLFLSIIVISLIGNGVVRGLHFLSRR